MSRDAQAPSANACIGYDMSAIHRAFFALMHVLAYASTSIDPSSNYLRLSLFCNNKKKIIFIFMFFKIFFSFQ